MKSIVTEKTYYIDLIGQSHDTKEKAEQSNHDIHLKFREYISEEMLITFEDGRLDKLATTLNLWNYLDYSSDCIKSVFQEMKTRTK